MNNNKFFFWIIWGFALAGVCFYVNTNFVLPLWFLGIMNWGTVFAEFCCVMFVAKELHTKEREVSK